MGSLISMNSDIKALVHIVGYGLLSAGNSKLLLQALETHKFNIIIIDVSGLSSQTGNKMSHNSPTSPTAECTLAYLQGAFSLKASVWSLSPVAAFLNSGKA